MELGFAEILDFLNADNKNMKKHINLLKTRVVRLK